MGDMADYALEQMMDEDETQLEELGHSIVFCVPRKVPVRCPACNGLMVVREGKFGKFHGCSNFPKCRDGPTFTVTHEPVLSDDDLDKMGRL
jgi:ssDNA-binding Zn-finger/Zn-ribbon topoisomerase 1